MKKLLMYSSLIITLLPIVFIFQNEIQTFFNSGLSFVIDLISFVLFVGLVIYVIIKYKKTPREELENPKLYKLFFILATVWVVLSIIVVIVFNIISYI